MDAPTSWAEWWALMSVDDGEDSLDLGSQDIVYSLDDFPEMDPDARVSSPRSLEACASEGIRVEDITYIPLATFQDADGNASPDVLSLRHDFFNARRQDLLEQARAAHAAIVSGTRAPVGSLLAGAGDADTQRRNRNTLAFFRQMLGEAPEQSAPGSPTSRPKSTVSLGRSMSAASLGRPKSTASLGRPMSTASLGRPTSTASLGWGGARPSTHHSIGDLSYKSQEAAGFSPMMSLSGGWSFGSAHSSTLDSSKALSEVLREVRRAPGSDRTEHDMAKRVEDSLLTFQEFEARRSRRRRENEERLIQKRVATSEANFVKLSVEQERKDHLRLFRELMAAGGGPASPAAGDASRRAAQERNLDAVRAGEAYRQDALAASAARQQAVESRVEEMRSLRRLRFAQQTMTDRLRFRYKSDIIMRRKAEIADARAAECNRKDAQRSDLARDQQDAKAFEKEVLGLREASRLLNRSQLERKEEYVSQQRDEQRTKGGLRRIQSSLRTADLSRPVVETRPTNILMLRGLARALKSKSDSSLALAGARARDG